MSSIRINANSCYEVTKSTTSWWIKYPSSRQHAAANASSTSPSSFGSDFADLMRNISLPGYAKLLNDSFCLWEKLIWFSVLVTVISALFALLSAATEQYVAHYFEISLFDPLFPIQNVPFPAISICSSNRISRRAAWKFARELSLNDPQKRNSSYFLEQISFLSILYGISDSTIYKDEEGMLKFQRYLDLYDTWENETSFNVRRRMEMLTPKCEELIMKCALDGNEIECFSKNAFQKRLTRYGFCCTFNVNDEYHQRSYNQQFVGSEYGLIVVLNTSHEDYFSEILNTDGTIVIVHDPNKYPDTFSGGSKEIFPSNREESFISIQAQMIGADDGLKNFEPNDRKCLFNDELHERNVGLYGRYNFNNCITRCRIKSITVLCRCLPFYTPQELFANSSEIAFCALQHKNCLDSYRFKWTNVLTQREPIIGLEREMEEALYCPQCIQSCEDIQYEISLMSLPVSRYRTAKNSLISNEYKNYQLEDITVHRIYFDEPHIQYFKRVLVNSWFESFSTIGNFCGIVIGFSLVVFAEIALFVVKYVSIGIRKFIENSRKDGNKDKDGNDLISKKTEVLIICP